jgi:PAS domain-containing protein
MKKVVSSTLQSPPDCDTSLGEYSDERRAAANNKPSMDRELLEEALFAEKERAQVTLECIGDAVICTDISGNITFLNLIAEKMTGWPLREGVGRPMADVINIRDGTTRNIVPSPMEMAVEQNKIMHLPSELHTHPA